MHIDKLKQADGWYVDAEGVNYPDAEAFLAYKIGMCGCGQPEEGFKYVLAVLRAVEAQFGRYDKDSDLHSITGPLWHSVGEREFVLHMLNEHGLLEHGGAIPGWLTPKGREIMDDLIEYLGKEKE